MFADHCNTISPFVSNRQGTGITAFTMLKIAVF
jgi:hypothetical protein